jgi:nitrous oxidase accessory protein NosD
MTFLNKATCCGLLTLGNIAIGATLCVNPGGTAGCTATIGAAVSAAKANDRINIAAGQYAEQVTITKPITLVGAGSDSTFINAKGQSIGIYVDGLDNPGMAHVLITGMTVMNANFEGILVTNASDVIISENHVTGNNQSLNVAAGTCAGLPVFETSEAMDCGEGIHLMAVDHSTVANNVSDLNSGGILISDETGITHVNLITGNSVHDNAYACGITMASHPVSPAAASKLPYGIFNNTIAGNNSSHNGHAGAGGAGIGIFAPGPGNMNFGNRVIGNVLEDNGHPGVTMHNHAAPPGAPGINLNDNMIVGNYISGNGADTADAATAGPTGIDIYSVAPAYGTLISENTIVNEAVDVVMNNPGTTELHFNNLMGGGVGVANPSGLINAGMNYFGCAGGPGATGCSTVGSSAVTSSPWLSAPVATAPSGGRGRQ